MKVTDLSHRFNMNDNVFPGTQRMHWERTHTVEKDGYNLSMLTINTHAGTHTDAPLHFLADGTVLADVDISKYVGDAFVCDCSAKGFPNAVVEKEDVEKYEAEIKAAGRVIFYTGWDVRFKDDNFFTEYPGISEELCTWLVSLGVKMVGVEGPSLNTTRGPEVHHILLENGVAVVEGLANLASLAEKTVLFCGAPLALEEMDGFPVRAYAIEM